MKEIAIQYFHWGWVITTVVMAVLGGYAGSRDNVKILVVSCLGCAVLGTVMLYFKYS